MNSGACYGDWIANPSGHELTSINPATDEPLAKVKMAGHRHEARGRVQRVGRPDSRVVSARRDWTPPAESPAASRRRAIAGASSRDGGTRSRGDERPLQGPKVGPT